MCIYYTSIYIRSHPFIYIYIYLCLFIHLSTRFSTYPSFPPSISPRLPIGAHEAHPIGYFEEQQLPAELHVSHGCTGPVIVAMGLVMLGMGDFTWKMRGFSLLNGWFDDLMIYHNVPHWTCHKLGFHLQTHPAINGVYTSRSTLFCRLEAFDGNGGNPWISGYPVQLLERFHWLQDRGGNFGINYRDLVLMDYEGSKQFFIFFPGLQIYITGLV